MNYIDNLNSLIRPIHETNFNFTVLDLFAGCGGLSLGFEANGFKTIGYEMDVNAAQTYNKNLSGKCIVERLSLNSDYPKAEILIGGPPCQPFSVGGKQNGLKDSRDGFPIFLDAVKKVTPEVILFENVRGMYYKNKSYLKEVLRELEKLGFQLNYGILNSKYYNVPQNRERLIVIGSHKRINFPSYNERIITAGEAINDLISQTNDKSKFLTPSMDAYIEKYEKASKCITPRDLNFDKPARTLTCRNLAGSTGDMQRIKLDNGKRRRITVREAARLQSFPDWFEFAGSESNQFNQIGNAVPPFFSYFLAIEIKKYLKDKDQDIYPISENNQYKLFENEAIYR